jgi:hypothetical protein
MDPMETREHRRAVFHAGAITFSVAVGLLPGCTVSFPLDELNAEGGVDGTILADSAVADGQVDADGRPDQRSADGQSVPDGRGFDQRPVLDARDQSSSDSDGPDSTTPDAGLPDAPAPDAPTPDATLAAVTPLVDRVSTGRIAKGSTSTRFKHRMGSGDCRLLLVGVSFGENKGDHVSFVAYNNVTLDLVGEASHPDSSTARVEVWQLIAPPVGKWDVDVVLTGTDHEGATIGVMGLSKASPSGPTESFSAASGDSMELGVQVPSSRDRLVLGVGAFSDSNDYDMAMPPGQTRRWELFQEKTNGAGATRVSEGSSVRLQWNVETSGKWVAAGISIVPGC